MPRAVAVVGMSGRLELGDLGILSSGQRLQPCDDCPDDCPLLLPLQAGAGAEHGRGPLLILHYPIIGRFSGPLGQAGAVFAAIDRSSSLVGGSIPGFPLEPHGKGSRTRQSQSVFRTGQAEYRREERPIRGVTWTSASVSRTNA